MTGNGNASQLWPKIRDALVDDPLTYPQKFLPVDFIEQEITEEAIKNELRRKWSLSNRALPGRIISEDARKVFTILVHIGEPAAIKDLLAEGLNDGHLPLRVSPTGRNDNTLVSHDERKTFTSFSRWKTEQRVTDFVDKQWLVLAPVFDSTGRHLKLESSCPLPFKAMEEVKGDYSSVVRKSEFHPAHYIGPEGVQVAVKEFRFPNDFEREKANLDTVQTLENRQNIITHLATFERGKKHYAVFPWADGGSLRDFWENQNGESRAPELALWSLQQMLNLASALQSLHGVNFRHGDIKPDNILHFPDSKGLGKLVIADVGVSRSHVDKTMMRHVGTTTRATTPSYEAPETVINHQAPRSRRYDVWSLGCIYLEFVIWFLHDVDALSSLGRARHAPYFEFYLQDPETKQATIHPIVSDAIDRLREDERCVGGTALEALINLVARHLLQIDVESRDDVEQVVAKMKHIVQQAEANPQYLFNSGMEEQPKMRFLERAQTGAPDHAHPSNPEKQET
ncbi:kinase-like domain-containing protein [Dendryphion nanum]|uniref:Kinase-like domain-containing protein n=1 Tax=Dendryphion nanum TaxID=256645 RepID=A0A9P9ILW1_9PLEO|nr:kinase-like domain-containing protein [Dendryphion nanum]